MYLRYLRLSRFPHPAPRVPRCVWRVVLSGCPLPLLAGTPFHAICAFRELISVGLSGPFRVPFACVCARNPTASALPPPGWCAVRTSRGPGRSTWSVPLRVSCPRPLLRVACLGGGGLGPVPPYLAWGCCCEGRLRSGAPPPPAARTLGGLLGAATHVLWARVFGCGGPTLSPWPACPVEAACRGAGVVGGRPPGGVACPDPPFSGAGSRGTATRVFRVRSVRAWGPSTSSTACGLAGRRCSLWGWRKGVPGGGAFHNCEGRLRSGAVPPPTARPLGALLGSTTDVLWVRVCGCGGPTLSPWPACPVGAACRGGVGGRPRGGWPATVVRGVWCQALSLPRQPVLWGEQPGFRDLCVPGAVSAGVGTQHRPHSVRPGGPALLAGGVAEGRPRGGCLPPL